METNINAVAIHMILRIYLLTLLTNEINEYRFIAFVTLNAELKKCFNSKHATICYHTVNT